MTVVPNLVAHGVLRLVDIGKNRRQGTVVPDGAAQYVGDVIFLQIVDDAVVDLLFLDKFGDGAVIPDPV